MSERDRNDAQVVVHLTDATAAFDLVESVHPRLFEAALAACDPAGALDRYSVVQIAETGLAEGARKLRTRLSTFSAKQWKWVVDRAIDAEMGSVALWPGEPFDERHLAPQLPPDYPVSTLKGVRAGPVRLTVSPRPDATIVELRVSSPEPLSTNELFDVVSVLLRPCLDLPTFELAAVGYGLGQPPDRFTENSSQPPAAIVCGPALDDLRRTRIEEHARRAGTPVEGDVSYFGAGASSAARLAFHDGPGR